MKLFSRSLLVRVLGLVVLAALAACQPAPPEEEGDGFDIGTEGTQSGVQVDPMTVIEHLQAAGLPIGRVDVLTAENDPAQRLGRPGQYVGKVLFHDTRHPEDLLQESGLISFANSGGTVETFSSVADREQRQLAVEQARAQFPAAPPEYQYTNGTVLLRLGGVLTPEQAAEYESALGSFQP